MWNWAAYQPRRWSKSNSGTDVEESARSDGLGRVVPFSRWISATLMAGSLYASDWASARGTLDLDAAPRPVLVFHVLYQLPRSNFPAVDIPLRIHRQTLRETRSFQL